VSFGAPYNATDSLTAKALAKIPDLVLGEQTGVLSHME